MVGSVEEESDGARCEALDMESQQLEWCSSPGEHNHTRTCQCIEGLSWKTALESGLYVLWGDTRCSRAMYSVFDAVDDVTKNGDCLGCIE